MSNTDEAVDNMNPLAGPNQERGSGTTMSDNTVKVKQLAASGNSLFVLDDLGRLWQAAIENSFRMNLSWRQVNAPSTPSESDAIERYVLGGR